MMESSTNCQKGGQVYIIKDTYCIIAFKLKSIEDDVNIKKNYKKELTFDMKPNTIVKIIFIKACHGTKGLDMAARVPVSCRTP